MADVDVEIVLGLELFQLDPRSRDSREVLHQYLAEVALLNSTDPLNELEIFEQLDHCFCKYKLCGRSKISVRYGWSIWFTPHPV